MAVQGEQSHVPCTVSSPAVGAEWGCALQCLHPLAKHHPNSEFQQWSAEHTSVLNMDDGFFYLFVLFMLQNRGNGRRYLFSWSWLRVPLPSTTGPAQPFLQCSLVSFDHVPQSEISPHFIMRNRTFRFFHVSPPKPIFQPDSAAVMAAHNNNHPTCDLD